MGTYRWRAVIMARPLDVSMDGYCYSCGIDDA